MRDVSYGLVDLHAHLMPGVDDGAADVGEARAGLEALDDQGARVVVATPHLAVGRAESDPEGWRERLTEIDSAWTRLRSSAQAAAPDLAVERGAELKLDAPPPDLSDPRLRLADTRYVAVEFGSLELPPFGADQLGAVREAGGRPVLAHPERYAGLGDRLETAAAWRSAGALLQVNAGSLVGQYGPEARQTAWALLERGWVDVVASDYHGRGKPRLSAARAALERVGDRGQAERLLATNPARLLEDRPPEPVPPLDGRGLWDRLRALMGFDRGTPVS